MSATFDFGVGRSLIVTGHPNHELAILGLVQRTRPFVLFLTDGGGERRMNESRRALADLGLLDHARFLAWPESRLYDALLTGDGAPFHELVAAIRAEVERRGVTQVLTEAVELYNPLHDVTAPLVRAALAGRDDVDLFEFPLIAQSRATPEEYRLQRLSHARRGDRVELALSGEELGTKLAMRHTHYGCLREQMGPVLASVPDAHFGVEEVAPMATTIPLPDDDLVLRYEWRGRRLQTAGDVRDVITYGEHFLPFVESLRNYSFPAASSSIGSSRSTVPR